MAEPSKTRVSSPETLNQPDVDQQRNSKKATLIAALAIGGFASFFLDAGVFIGGRWRDGEVARLQETTHAQDWLLDQGITPIKNDGVTVDKNNVTIVRMQPNDCKQPISLIFEDEALHLTQRDAEGNIYASFVMKSASETEAVLAHVCS